MKENKRKPILCLDFDGVLHSYTSGWQGANIIPDPPVSGAIRFLYDAHKVFEVHIFSSRSHQPGGIEAMRKWLAHYVCKWGDITGINPGWMAKIQWPQKKPPAMVSIDDRAITFTGKWPQVEDLLAFKPWNKKEVQS